MSDISPPGVGPDVRTPGAYLEIAVGADQWPGSGITAPGGGLERLPDPRYLQDGALLQVVANAWYVETLWGWAPARPLPPGPLLPVAVALPDGALLQVAGRIWTVETAPGVWTDVETFAPQPGGVPNPAGQVDGSLLMGLEGRWQFLG